MTQETSLPLQSVVNMWRAGRMQFHPDKSPTEDELILLSTNPDPYQSLSQPMQEIVSRAAYLLPQAFVYLKCDGAECKNKSTYLCIDTCIEFTYKSNIDEYSPSSIQIRNISVVAVEL